MLTVISLALMACTPADDSLCTEGTEIQVYLDEDADGFGLAGTGKKACGVQRGFATNQTDCDDTRADINPGSLEICDGFDNNCNDDTDEGLRQTTFYQDADNDGFGDPDVSELSCNPSGGYTDNKDDCDDADANRNPDATEVCDDIDNNCNGLVDDFDPFLDLTSAPFWYYDDDGDGYGGEIVASQRCDQPGPGVVQNTDDCDDDDIFRFPGAGESCNGYDDDCDGLIDDSDPDIDPSELTTFFADLDGDGAGDPDNTADRCFLPWDYVTNEGDCNDDEPLLTDPAPWLVDNDNDGFGAGAPSADSCTAPGPDFVLEAYGEDCVDDNIFIYPGAPEVCDGLDNDCDFQIDDDDPGLDGSTGTTFYADTDNDGYGDIDVTKGACALIPGYVEDDTDCNDDRFDINPGAPEICDGIDNNCDPYVDDADPLVDLSSSPTWWLDSDSDGYGNPAIDVVACTQPTSYVDNDDDCDDTDGLGIFLTEWWRDGDGDGAGVPPIAPESCTSPGVDFIAYDGSEQDCDDSRDDMFPGNDEICNDGIDQDCLSGDLDCPPDNCFQAQSETKWTTGLTVLNLDLAGQSDSFSLSAGNSCTDNAALGTDVVYPVRLQSGELLSATYEGVDDLVMMAVSDCNDVLGTCAAGVDNDGFGGTEYLEFFNASVATADAYLILDCTGPSCGDVTITADISTPTPDWIADTCADTSSIPVYATGTYTLSGNTAIYANDVRLGFLNPCTGWNSNGGDAWIPVEVQNGEQLYANYRTHQGGDISLYLWEDCSNSGSCVDGSDVAGAVDEDILYTNVSGSTQTMYVGIDCFDTTCGAFELDLVIR